MNDLTDALISLYTFILWSEFLTAPCASIRSSWKATKPEALSWNALPSKVALAKEKPWMKRLRTLRKSSPCALRKSGELHPRPCHSGKSAFTSWRYNMEVIPIKPPREVIHAFTRIGYAVVRQSSTRSQKELTKPLSAFPADFFVFQFSMCSLLSSPTAAGDALTWSVRGVSCCHCGRQTTRYQFTNTFE